MIKWNFLIMLCFNLSYLHAQDQYKTPLDLNGYWTGAMIYGGNSIQALDVDIYQEGERYTIESSIPDWMYYPPKISEINIEGGKISFQSYYGEIILRLDSGFEEMIGELASEQLEIKVHLKKSLLPAKVALAVKEITLERAGAQLNGTLYFPKYHSDQLACAVFIHGRGCRDRSAQANKAKMLAEYGIATFVYDKRGSESSGFPCDESTHDLNVEDINQIIKKLATQEVIDPNKIGLISYSAGGWIAAEVTESSEHPIAFFISMVGPSTSVKEQQLDGLEAFLQAEGFSQASLKEAKEYTELLFTKTNYEEAFKRIEFLMKKAKESGWDQWLEEDDYVSHPDSFGNLWVQRFNYDPSAALQKYKAPYLAIYGETDLIVPYQKQIRRLKEIKGSEQAGNYQISVLRSSNHGLEHGNQLRKIAPLILREEEVEYLKFDRVAYGAMQELVDFLNEKGFLLDGN